MASFPSPKGSLKRYSFHSVTGSRPIVLVMASGQDQTLAASFGLTACGSIDTEDASWASIVSTARTAALESVRPATKSHDMAEEYRAMILTKYLASSRRSSGAHDVSGLQGIGRLTCESSPYEHENEFVRSKASKDRSDRCVTR